MYRISIFIVVLFTFTIFSILSVRAETVNLQIVEAMVNPLGDDTKLEWVEILNQSSVEENLENWTFQGKPLPFFNISPGGVVVIVKDEQAFRSTYLVDTGFVKADFRLLNAGGELQLQSINSSQKSTFTYGSSEEGKSFERLTGNCDLIRKNDSSHTLGKPNTNCSIINDTLVPSIQPTVLYSTTSSKLPDLMFSSIMPNPESGDEWIELFNSSNADIDLDGFTIMDKTDKSYKINSVLIRSQERQKIYPNTISLNNEGDTIRLLDKSANRIDIIMYGESKKGVPFELIQVTANESSVLATPTLPQLINSTATKSIEKSVESNNKYFRIPIYYESGDLK